MTDMPKRRPENLHKETNRHGTTVWYVRIGKGPRIRIREAYGTPAWKAEVAAAQAGQPLTASRKPITGSIAWAASLYRQSHQWAKLSPATRKQRDNILHRIVTSPAGAGRLGDLTKKHITEGLRTRAATPAAARHFLQTMRGLFAWAIAEDHVTDDPTVGIVAQADATEGHLPWNDADLAAYEARWPLGTRERVAYAVLRYTGLRRGDAVQCGRQHVRDGVLRIKTEKTGERVAIVMEAPLVAALEAGPCGDLAFIAGERGAPRVKASFGEWFRGACRAAGVSKSAHGLRKTAATKDAEDGYSEAELEAKYGWRGGRMASRYTRSANREKLAIQAAARVSRANQEHRIPAPDKSAGILEEKS